LFTYGIDVEDVVVVKEWTNQPMDDLEHPDSADLRGMRIHCVII
jgi:hypothetical protein